MSVSAALEAGKSAEHRLVLEPRPSPLREWAADFWAHRETLYMLARNDFHVRYKRASFGVLWAVAVPVLQATVLAVIFSRFIRFGGDFSYAAYAASGILAWSYFGQTLAVSSTAIVERSDLADKVWFPRALLVVVPCLANLPALLISQLLLLSMLPVLGVDIEAHTLLLVPAVLLLVSFTVALSLVLSALHVYFRDVRYLVQAGLLVFLYATPIFYPQLIVGGIGPWLDFNPATGVINLFHVAAVGSPDAWATDLPRSIAISVAFTLGLATLGVELQRRRDRLFVDLL